jgi:ketosteroid isomerase-like protein
MIDPALEQRIRDAFAAWSRGEHELDPSWTSPDVEVRSAIATVTGRLTYRGREGVEQWVADVTDAFDEWRLELDELDEVAPGRVLGVGTVHLRGRGSGATVDEPCAWILEHDNGVLTSFEASLNRVDEARELAAGASR